MKKKHVIIGVSAAGLSAARKLLQLAPGDEIICITHETETPYNKCHLASYLLGDIGQEGVLTLKERDKLKNALSIRYGIEVTRIDTKSRVVYGADGFQESYDTLFIGSGSSPFMPPLFRDASYENVCTFHSLKDTENLRTLIANKAIKRAVIIGAGLSGLECADALQHQGIEVSVIERTDCVLARQINQKAADLLHHNIGIAGASLYTSREVQDISVQHNRISTVILDDGTALETDIVIITCGLQPNTAFLAESGILLKQGHIIVNEYLETNIAGVYAGGDAILVKDLISQQLMPSRAWPDAMLQGMIAGSSMADQQKSYEGTIVVTSSAFFGLKFATCGPMAHADAAYEYLEKHGDGWYHCFALQDGILKGFLLMGNTALYPQYRRAVLTNQEFASIR